jgi:alpha-D-xyloside xylohydrolase
VSGYKIDEVDGYDHYLWPDIATFPSGISAEQMRQTYGVLAMRYTAECFIKKIKEHTDWFVQTTAAAFLFHLLFTMTITIMKILSQP